MDEHDLRRLLKALVDSRELILKLGKGRVVTRTAPVKNWFDVPVVAGTHSFLRATKMASSRKLNRMSRPTSLGSHASTSDVPRCLGLKSPARYVEAYGGKERDGLDRVDVDVDLGAGV